VAPLHILLPLIVARWTSGDAPWHAFLAAYPARLLVGLLTALLVAAAPAPGAPRALFYALVACAMAMQAVVSQVQFVSQMAFFARVSDPSIGGTAMTLLNTVANLGGKWPTSVALFLAEPMTRRACEGAAGVAGQCGGAGAREACAATGGVCVTHKDAFTPLTVVCTLLGVAWLAVARRPVVELQKLPHSAWLPGQRSHKP
jgi:PAT family acetyl-CoA transporter-like MFS transporter 1